MTEASQDTKRTIAAGKELFDGRDPVADFAAVLVTLDHLIASVLLVTMQGDPRRAVNMLHEGTLQGVEERIALFASKDV